MIPRLAFDGWNAAEFLVRFGARLHHRQVSIATENDKVSSGKQKLAVAVTPVLPFARASLRIQADQYILVQTVEVAFPENRAGKLIFQILVPPNFPRALAGKFHRGATSVIPGGEKETIAAQEHRLGNIAIALQDHPREIPEHLASFNRQAHRARFADHQQLPLSAQRRNHRRTVRRLFVRKLPEQVAAKFIVGRYMVRDDDQFVFDNQWRSGHAISETSIARVFAPDQFAIVCRETAQFTQRAQNVHTAILVSGRGARAVAAQRFGELRRPGMGPEFTAGSDIVRGGRFLLAALFDGEGATIAARKRSVTATHRLFPKQTEIG